MSFKERIKKVRESVHKARLGINAAAPEMNGLLNEFGYELNPQLGFNFGKKKKAKKRSKQSNPFDLGF